VLKEELTPVDYAGAQAWLRTEDRDQLRFARRHTGRGYYRRTTRTRSCGAHS
jgi:hypothetical protein